MLTIEILAIGEVIVQRDLLRFSANVTDFSPAMEAAGTILREATEAQFDTQGSYASGGWPELAAATLAYKARHGLDPRILRATENLFTSLTRKFDARHIEQVSATSLRFGTTLSYAVFHQSTRPRRKIPYRPPVALTEGDKRRIVNEIQRHAVSGLVGQGAL